MARSLFLLLICLLLSSPTLYAQQQTILLGEPTTLDQLSRGIKSFYVEPVLSPITAQIVGHKQEELILPPDTADSYFFSVFVNQKEDGQVFIMVTPDDHGEWLHIDLNNDNDLTNDGGPYLFSHHENEFSFFITHTADPQQKTGRLLLRYPRAVYKDPTKLQQFIDENFDPNGNLNQYWTNYWRRHNPEFKGEKSTFYYADRLRIRKGKVDIEEVSYVIGIYDWTANGKYDDRKDKLLIDLNRDGKLTSVDNREIFKPTDTFPVGNKLFQLSSIDPYGRSLTIKEVKQLDTDTRFYLSQSDSANATTILATHFTAHLRSEFWEEEFETLNKETLSMSSLKGRFILLNFWGEWCMPCYKEIPLLAEANQSYKDEKLKIISFLNAGNLPKAQEVIMEYNMNWTHILLDETTEGRFKITSYPHNILILPDGKTAIISGGIEEGYFEDYIN